MPIATERDIQEYLEKDYPIAFGFDREATGDAWFVKAVGLDGCMSQGSSFDEACFMIVDAVHGWIAIVLEDGEEIPEPLTEFSGTCWDAVLSLPMVVRIGAAYRYSKDLP